MTAIDSTPGNPNFLSPLNFVFSLKRAPHVNFFIQECNIPGLALRPLNVPTPLVRIPYGGDHIMYNELSITFKVDEDLQNYMEIFTWLKSLGKQEYQYYANLETQPVMSAAGLKSDILMTILDGTKNPNYQITYRDCIPISLSDVKFRSDAQDVNYVSASAQFRYTLFDIDPII